MKLEQPAEPNWQQGKTKEVGWQVTVGEEGAADLVARWLMVVLAGD